MCVPFAFVNIHPTLVAARRSRLSPCLSLAATVSRKSPKTRPVSTPLPMFENMVTTTANPAPAKSIAVPRALSPSNPAVLGLVQLP